MDTSKEYIKMCDCEEIQQLWKRQAGDFYSINREDVCVYFGMDDSYMMWLPRQDQLQGMRDTDCCGDEARAYAEFMDDDIWRNDFGKDWNCSHEKGWLMFVMKEKHSKIWNGNNWENI